MQATANRTIAVARRALQQLRRDHRFMGFSLLFPLIIIYFIKVLFSVLASPFFDASIYVIPYGAFIVHFVTFILTAIVLVRERTAGTLARMFVSGYRQVEIIVGYILAYSVLATMQSLLVLVEINILFELDYGSAQLASVYLVMWMLAIISMALGILVSNFARNEGQVIPFIPLVLLSFFISGILLPVEQLPEWTQLLSYATPLFYANEVLQNLIAGGVLRDDWFGFVSIPLYGLVVLSLAMFSLRETD